VTRLLFAVVALAACQAGEPEARVYEPYAGPPAYPNRREPIALSAATIGVTSDNGSDTLTVIDLDRGEVIATRPVGRSPVDRDGPHHLAIDSLGRFVYVALAYPAPSFAPGPQALARPSSRPGWVHKLALDDLRLVGEVEVENDPGDVVLSEDAGRLVVSHYDLRKALAHPGDPEAQRATIAVIDTAAIATTPARFIATCVAAHGIALAGSRAFIACYGEDAIAIVDLDSGAVERIAVGPGGGVIGAPTYGPYSASLSPAADRVAIGNLESREVRFLDVASRSIEPLVITTDGAPYLHSWSPDGQRLYLPTQSPDAILVVDATSGAEIARRDFDASTCLVPHDAVVAADELALHVVCRGNGSDPGRVLTLDPMTLETRASVTVGVYPDRLALVRRP
jgi:DNA-binding beta-propeller fold protein YncE